MSMFWNTATRWAATKLNWITTQVPPPPRAPDDTEPRKVLLVHAHPIGDSFSNALADAVEDEDDAVASHHHVVAEAPPPPPEAEESDEDESDEEEDGSDADSVHGWTDDEDQSAAKAPAVDEDDAAVEVRGGAHRGPARPAA